MYTDIVIVQAARTPFGRYCGSLKELDYYELGALPIRDVLRRADITGDQVDEVFWGVGDTSVCKDVYTPGLLAKRYSGRDYRLRRLLFLSTKPAYRPCPRFTMDVGLWSRGRFRAPLPVGQLRSARNRSS